MTDKLEDKNDFNTKGIDILNPEIIEKLEKIWLTYNKINEVLLLSPIYFRMDPIRFVCSELFTYVGRVYKPNDKFI